MHEISIAERLVELIEEESRNHGFSRVKAIRLKIGMLGHVEPDALQFCFESVSQGTLAEGAYLELETIAGVGWCSRCRRTVAIAERYDVCPACSQIGVRMTAGDELRLTELVVE